VTEKEFEILLVEGDPRGVKLTLHALRAENAGNSVEVVRDTLELEDVTLVATNS